MIVVSGEFHIDTKDIDAARTAMIAMAAETAKEDGCIHYRFYQDVEHPDRFHVYEEWESDAHLAAHAATAHMATFRRVLETIDITDRDIHRYEVANIAKM